MTAYTEDVPFDVSSVPESMLFKSPTSDHVSGSPPQYAQDLTQIPKRVWSPPPSAK